MSCLRTRCQTAREPFFCTFWLKTLEYFSGMIALESTSSNRRERECLVSSLINTWIGFRFRQTDCLAFIIEMINLFRSHRYELDLIGGHRPPAFSQSLFPAFTSVKTLVKLLYRKGHPSTPDHKLWVVTKLDMSTFPLKTLGWWALESSINSPGPVID